MLLSGNANQLVDSWESDPAWINLGHDHLRASQMSEQGYLVVAGEKEEGHGHVVIIVPGQGSHGQAMGYRGRLGGIGDKNKGLNFAWRHSALENVEYFARPASALAAKP